LSSGKRRVERERERKEKRALVSQSSNEHHEKKGEGRDGLRDLGVVIRFVFNLAVSSAGFYNHRSVSEERHHGRGAYQEDGFFVGREKKRPKKSVVAANMIMINL
jgi:hypothetical protein